MSSSHTFTFSSYLWITFDYLFHFFQCFPFVSGSFRRMNRNPARTDATIQPECTFGTWYFHSNGEGIGFAPKQATQRKVEAARPYPRIFNGGKFRDKTTRLPSRSDMVSSTVKHYQQEYGRPLSLHPESSASSQCQVNQCQSGRTGKHQGATSHLSTV